MKKDNKSKKWEVFTISFFSNVFFFLHVFCVFSFLGAPRTARRPRGSFAQALERLWVSLPSSSTLETSLSPDCRASQSSSTSKRGNPRNRGFPRRVCYKNKTLRNARMLISTAAFPSIFFGLDVWCFCLDFIRVRCKNGHVYFLF